MNHIYLKGNNQKTLILLHGTGGSEQDLIPLAKTIDKNANILSLRGNVKEGHMNRFFRRLAFGVFDLEDVTYRSNEALDFIIEASTRYGFDIKQTTAIGYSNGANLLLSMLFLKEVPFEQLILSHPMLTYKDKKPLKQQTKTLITYGNNDPMTSLVETQYLIKLMDEALVLTTFSHQNGHQLTNEEVREMSRFYQS
ncbi:Phospholipase/carboxylesterase family protein [Paracholeplasma brassicae]|uniref:Phospholipase/carboxylesterase family protein n=1 Tax=Acholeplasma brassicae TaxID=61635 RepID=U4KPT4_9MOLU|nr:phospholipase/carboxylesterase [Paracholeplasma brassicae]CCV66482.1 Phospholipase/carboxylesterase family protein [Paracholeplasma brassicae]